MENKKQITIKIAENGCIRKPVYSLEFAKGVFMANEDGHKFTQRTCRSPHRCEGCDGLIEPGEQEIEHNFLMNGHWCTEYYHDGCL